MNVYLMQETTSNSSDWVQFFRSLNANIQEIKKLNSKEFVYISKPTGFIFFDKVKGKHFIAGYTTKTNCSLSIETLNPKISSPYSSNRVESLSLENFHKCLKYRIKILDTLNTNISDLKYFELSRKCILAAFWKCNLDTEVLYKREHKLLKKMDCLNPILYKRIRNGRNNFFEILHGLYHKRIHVREDFIMIYKNILLESTYKWK